VSGNGEFHREYALTDKRFEAALRRNEINVFKSQTKYSTSDDVIERLAYYADREPLKYEHLREYAAQRLGCRASVLDKLVEKHRKPKKAENLVPVESPGKDDGGLQGSAALCVDVEPWPDPVEGAAILDEVAASFARYIVLPEGAEDVLALWSAHTLLWIVYLLSALKHHKP
jgi:hypothetical protein